MCHSSPEITLKVYSHLLKEEAQDISDSINRNFFALKKIFGGKTLELATELWYAAREA